jgi:hypothetical protein
MIDTTILHKDTRITIHVPRTLAADDDLTPVSPLRSTPAFDLPDDTPIVRTPPDVVSWDSSEFQANEEDEDDDDESGESSGETRL